MWEARQVRDEANDSSPQPLTSSLPAVDDHAALGYNVIAYTPPAAVQRWHLANATGALTTSTSSIVFAPSLLRLQPPLSLSFTVVFPSFVLFPLLHVSTSL